MFDDVEFVIDTGNDDLRADSELDFSIRDTTPQHTVVASSPLHPAGNAPLWDNYTEHGAPPLNFSVPQFPTQLATIELQFTPGGGVDEWHMESIQVYASSSSLPGQLVCLFKGNGIPEHVFDPSHTSMTVNVGDGCP